MSAPIKIEGLPIVVAFNEHHNRRVQRGHRYYPTEEERDKEGLRIEIVTYTWDGEDRVRHEARLVKGPIENPKHLYVIKIKNWNTWRLNDAVWRLRKEFFEKGW